MPPCWSIKVDLGTATVPLAPFPLTIGNTYKSHLVGDLRDNAVGFRLRSQYSSIFVLKKIPLAPDEVIRECLG